MDFFLGGNPKGKKLQKVVFLSMTRVICFLLQNM